MQTLDFRLRGNDKGPSLFPCFYPRGVLGGGLSDKFHHRGFQGFAPSIWRWSEKRCPVIERWSKLNGYREVLAISLPLVASMGYFTVMQFTDLVFLANYSVDAIAAARPAGIASFTLISFFMGVGNYTNVFGSPVALGGGLPVRCTQTGRGFTRQKYGGFTSPNPRCLFFLDFQVRIRLYLNIACYF